MVLVVLITSASLFAVPVIVILALQIATNWFVHETESSLIKQAAIYASAYSSAFEAIADHSVEKQQIPGYYLPPDKRVFWNAKVRTFGSLLDLRINEIKHALPDPMPSKHTLDMRYREIAVGLNRLEERAGRVTLSRAIFLDFRGLDLLSVTPASFAEVPEVQKALRGEIGAALRWRSNAKVQAPIFSLLRGTGFRVLVAYPVISYNRVVGAVYISRTPLQLDSWLSRESLAILILISVTVLAAVVMGMLLVRTVLRPIRALRDQSRRIAQGAHDELEPLDHYGIREVAELGDAVMTMASSLSQRAQEIGIYTDHVTHELKSPVTAIIGSAELLEDGCLPQTVQRKLLATIKSQGVRMNRLLTQLREVSRSRHHFPGKPGALRDMLPDMPNLAISVTYAGASLPLSVAHGQVILEHMAQNAIYHGADQMTLDWNGQTLRITDNGQGFAAVDISRLGEPFFTTRREEGGTGLGLAIVIAILRLYNAQLSPVPSAKGATFEIIFG
ncbi:HAMP domain-containing protein [Ochrobactrum intermedium]|uniref:histidine kinase dimerization/phospho-acceptor domain-containing protein n=1 Tax=Brucella intermedia TaxID=94625 RepID=UPI00128D5CEC|nr:histidine kinase dimerization/phospho-acceptor domain-containing protein [Brucella intermedia]MPR64265.1 HAMP domain-containing protein [Brucella intermedia]